MHKFLPKVKGMILSNSVGMPGTPCYQVLWFKHAPLNYFDYAQVTTIACFKLDWWFKLCE